jgi:hypothetical protein
MRAERITERRHLIAAIGAGVTLRIAAAVYIGNQVGERLPGVADQLSYHTLALRVLDGHGFSFATGWWPATPAGSPTAHWSYLYTGFLCTVYAVFGPNPLAARLLQAVAVGVVHPLLSWRVGRRLGGARVARYAVYGAALYPYFVYYGAALMTEALYFVAILWVIQVALELGDAAGTDTGAWRSWLALGIGTAVAGLLRQAFLFCLPLVWLWIGIRWIAARETSTVAALRRFAAGLVGATVVTVVCIAPVTVRNYLAFGRFVPLNTNAGFAFFWGNHPAHGTTFKPLLPSDGGAYGALIPDELRPLDEAALDQALLGRGVQFVIDDPVRYLQLTTGRVREYFKFWPSPDSSLASNVMRTCASGVLLPLALLGVLLVSGSGNRSRVPVDRTVAILLLSVAAGYAVLHVLVWALVRYRLPVDTLILPMAAVATTWLADRFRNVALLRAAGAPPATRCAEVTDPRASSV